MFVAYSCRKTIENAILYVVIRAKSAFMRPSAAIAVVSAALLTPARFAHAVAAEKTLYDFSVQALDGSTVSLSQYRSSPVALVVNTASQCGLAKNNYPELEALYQKYKDQGFVVLSFPCSQFMGQEPLTNQDLPAFMKAKGLTFPVFGKVSVNGDDTHPLFAWLKEKAPGYLVDTVKWNFTKFLVVNGVPRKRYRPNESPLSIESDVVAAIREVKATGSTVIDATAVKSDSSEL